MLRSSSSLLASIALVFCGFSALGAASAPAAGPALKTIAVVVAHAHRSATATIHVPAPAVTNPG